MPQCSLKHAVHGKNTGNLSRENISTPRLKPNAKSHLLIYSIKQILLTNATWKVFLLYLYKI